MTCLQSLVSHKGPVGCSQLADELGLSVTQVNRLLKTLAHMGFVQQVAGVKYEAGPGVHVIAAQSLYGSGLLRAALGPLNGLAALNVVVAFGVLWQDKITYFYHRKPGMPAEDAISGHGLYPAAESVLGHILLSGLSDDQLRAMYRNMSAEKTETLIQTLHAARKQGYGRMVTGSGGIGIAMPVGTPWCGAAALSDIPAGTDIKPYLHALQQSVQQINTNLNSRKR